MIVYGVNPVLEAIRSHPDRVRYVAVAREQSARLQKVVAEVSKAYELRGVPDSLVAHYPDSGHDFPDAERHQAYEWLDEILR